MRPRVTLRSPLKPETQEAARRKKRNARERERRRVYALVDARDGNRCRVCGDADTWLERHHIVYLSRGGGDTLQNIIKACILCHVDIHNGDLKVSGTADALVVTRRAA